MITLAKFMGGGESKVPAIDFIIGLGVGRVNVYRPGSNKNASLLDPASDVFRKAGFPYYFIINDATAGKVLTIKTHTGSTIIAIDGGQVGAIGLYVDASGNKQWTGILYTRYT